MIADLILNPLKPHVSPAHFERLTQLMAEHFKAHGNDIGWDSALAKIPDLNDTKTDLSSDTISVLADTSLDPLQSSLEALMPWRKGPWHLLGTDIDTEWRSDWKWQRLSPHITSLAGRDVLDIGCGNGYHLFRMLGAGAHLALGVDPTRLFLYQFELVKKLMAPNNAYLLPLRSEQLPAFGCFDSVFSMGVLYHRRAPLDHINELTSFLRPGGELVLETLVVPGGASTVLVPVDRYAKMANVWFLPSTLALEGWLKKLGLINVRTVDVCLTTTEEQRKTAWMQYQSLADFLDPNNADLTIEGYPAPKRVIIVANKPNQ